MKKLSGLAVAFLFLLSLSFPIFAAPNNDPAAACGAMGCGIVVWLLVMLVALAVGIGVMVFIIKWIKKDATTRGMPNASSIAWLGLLGLLGLLIYVLQRPQGNVMPCPRCGQPRMQGLPACPHCHQP